MKQNLRNGFIVGMAMCLCPALGVMAEDADSDSQTIYYLRVVNTDGSQVCVPFSEKPEIQYSNNAIVLTSEEINMEYPDGTLDFFDITTENTLGSVCRLSTDASLAKGLISDGDIVFTNGTPGAALTVVALDGSVVATARLDNDGNARLPFSPQKSGVYVIKSGNSTFKLIKK